MDIWRISSGNSYRWPQWKNDGVIAVGWVDLDVEKGKDPAQLSKIKLKDLITDRYPDSNPGSAAGHIKSIAGTHWNENQQMKKRDVAIITPGKENPFNENVVLAVAKLGKYRYEPEGVGNVADHPYLRKVSEWLYGGPRRGEGPVPIDNIESDKFRKKGEYAVSVRGTRAQGKYGAEAHKRVNELVGELQDAKNNSNIEARETGVKVAKERPVQRYIKKEENDFFDGNVNFRREFPIDRGEDGVRLDMLDERENQKDVIVEIKRWQADNDALEQLKEQLRRYNQVRNRDARGYLMAQSFSSEVENKVNELENIDLKRFSVEIKPT